MGAVVSLDGFMADDDDVDLTNGWDGKPAAGEHVFVVTHRRPTDWEYADTAPFTFVDGVEKAITTAKEFAGGPGRRRGRRSPAAWPSRYGWRTRPRSCAATGSHTWSTTSAARTCTAHCRQVG
jgi:hypothetical protein